MKSSEKRVFDTALESLTLITAELNFDQLLEEEVKTELLVECEKILGYTDSSQLKVF